MEDREDRKDREDREDREEREYRKDRKDMEDRPEYIQTTVLEGREDTAKSPSPAPGVGEGSNWENTCQIDSMVYIDLDTMDRRSHYFEYSYNCPDPFHIFS